jgi:hypothetical protein
MGGSLAAMRRRFGALVGLLVAGTLLSGCVAFKGLSATQGGVVGGAVTIQLTICANEPAPADHPGCELATNRPFVAPSDAYQVLLAFRLPAGMTAPDSFASTAGEALTFTRNASYERELDRLVPAGEGRVWIGYLSSPYTLAYAAGDPARQSTVAPAFGLPRPADGDAFHGPLAFRPVVGGREIGDSGEPQAGDPVACGTAVNGDPTACVDFPLVAELGTNANVAVSDFGIVAGKATASPGQTVMLPFGVRGAGGMPAGLTTALSAATTLPGVAAVTPSLPSAPLSNGSDTRVTVPVVIPGDSPPGVFDVVLTGRLDNGQTRTGVAKLTVRDRQKPVLSKLKAKPKLFKAATKRKPKRGTNVSFTLSEAASVRWTVERCTQRKRGRCVRWRALKGGLTKPGAQGANKVRFNGRLRGKVLKAGGYRLVVVPTDGAANRGAAVRTAIAIRR